jgi:hypothetical protein
MDFAEHQELADQLRTILHRRQGTLYLSWVHLLELSEISDTRQIDRIESFLAAVFPNLGFMELTPGVVIAQEDQWVRGESIDPTCDVSLLRYYTDFSRANIAPLSPRGFLACIRSPQAVEMCRTFMVRSDIVAEVAALRQRSRNNPRYLAHPVQVPVEMMLPWTRYIFRETMCLFIRDSLSLSDPHHWCDFHHMVVPIAYCDFVLLDSAWATKAWQVQTRIHPLGQPSKMARVFSPKQLPEFWTAFETDGMGTTSHCIDQSR